MTIEWTKDKIAGCDAFADAMGSCFSSFYLLHDPIT